MRTYPWDAGDAVQAAFKRAWRRRTTLQADQRPAFVARPHRRARGDPPGPSAPLTAGPLLRRASRDFRCRSRTRAAAKARGQPALRIAYEQLPVEQRTSLRAAPARRLHGRRDRRPGRRPPETVRSPHPHGPAAAAATPRGPAMISDERIDGTLRRFLALRAADTAGMPTVEESGPRSSGRTRLRCAGGSRCWCGSRIAASLPLLAWGAFVFAGAALRTDRTGSERRAPKDGWYCCSRHSRGLVQVGGHPRPLGWRASISSGWASKSG